MRAALAAALLLILASGAWADLGNVDTSLREIAFDEVQVSPDGSRLAFITRDNDFEQDREVSTLWRIDLGPGNEASRPVRLAEPGAYASLRWSPDGRSLSYLSPTAPGGAFQLFLLDMASGSAPRRVTDPVRFENGIDLYDWLPDGKGFIVLAADPPDAASLAAQARWRELHGDVRRRSGPPPASSLYKVARDGGRVERVAASPFETAQLLSVSPDSGQIAVAGSALQGGVESAEAAILSLAPGAPPRRTRNRGWEETLTWAGKDLFVSVAGEEKDGRYTSTEARLLRVNAEDMRLVPAALNQEGYLKQQVSLADGSMLVTANISTRMRVSRLEPGSGKIRTLLEQRGWIANLSASRDGGVIAFVTSDSRHFPEIYVARGLDGMAQARPVTDFNAALTREPLPEIETVSWDDGEGTVVEGVLFWPPGRKGEKGLPLIVELHGGPLSVARTEAVSLAGQFLSFPAVLAARGFLVLNPNFRGGAGRGDEFAQGIEGRRCSRPSQDVIRGVESLVARGWADRQRIGLMGYSGGGGLSKCLLSRTHLFRAVSTGSGVWNDIALYSSVRGRMWADSFFLGKSPWEDFGLWWRESPVSGLERIKTPTLILAGERDGDAPRHADELYRGLVARGVTAEYLIFPGEGHVFTQPSHKRAKMRAEISWFEHYLLGKPRAELP
jgi:dipeptidyl aminopeptidase/acylaminoacyl peptidase